MKSFKEWLVLIKTPLKSFKVSKIEINDGDRLES